LPAFEERDFVWFWFGALISNVGTWMQLITVPYVILKLTGSGAWVGLTAFAGLFPAVVASPIAGSLADRFERRTLLLWSQLAQMLLALALWGLWEGGLRRPILLVLLVAANGVFWGGTIPAWQAFISSLVPRDKLLNAITLNSAQFNAARAVGPAIGGAALASFGPSWAFLLNALSFVAVIVALLAVRTRRPPVAPRQDGDPGLWAAFGAGLRYTWRHTGIFLAIALVAVVSLFASPVFQLLPVVASKVFRVGPGLYGLLAGAFGVGAVLGAVALSAIGSRYDRSRLVTWGLVAYGGSLVALGAAPLFGIGVAAVAVMGVGFLGTLAVLNTTVQLLVAEEIRGRVLAVWAVVVTAFLPLGALAEGSLSDLVGMRPICIGGGLVLLATAGVLITQSTLASSLDEHSHRRIRPVSDGSPPAWVAPDARY
jgi:MFS family permease